MQTEFLTIRQIKQNPLLVTQSIYLEKATGSEKVVFQPLLHTHISGLLEFFENLSERTRRFATYPGYDLACAQKYCDEIDYDNILRMVAALENGKIVALLEFNFDFTEFDVNRYRKHGVELNAISDIQFAPCIIDEYQNQNLGTKLLYLMINLAKQLDKKRIIAWAGVLIDNEQGIRFYEKNRFKVFREKYIAEDGYECYDAILELS